VSTRPDGRDTVPFVPLTATAQRHFDSGIADVRAAGTLDVAGAAAIRRAVLKCAADSPVAVLIDLAGIDAASDAGLTVLPTLQRRLAHDDPPVPLLGYAPAGSVARSPDGPFVVHPDRAAAVIALAADRAVERRAHLALPPERTSSAGARRFVVDTCGRWGLAHLADEAQLIVAELVANAVEHAGTDLAVTVARGSAHLTLTVHDRSRRPPVAAKPSMRAVKGRGLMMVAVVADGWGTVLHGDGKAVWANLRLSAPAGLDGVAAG
jgi:hypothetical protein